jgi:hypothetical protein
VHTNDIMCRVTEFQYLCLMDIIRNVFLQAPADPKLIAAPDVPKANRSRIGVTFQAPHIILEVFWKTQKMEKPERYSLAKFVTSTAQIKLNIEQDIQMEITFRSLSMFDTRQYQDTVFREMMTPLTDVEDQFILKYSAKGDKSIY